MPSTALAGSSGQEQAPLRREDGPEYGSTRLTRRKTLPRRWYIAYYVPSLSWIENYKWSYLPGDICAGLSLASFQLPISLSYASSLAHVPITSGCFGLIIPPLVYAMLGSVPQMVIGPEAAISLVLGHAVLGYTHDSTVGLLHESRSDLSPAKVTSLLTGTVGAIVLAMGLMRLGFLESIMSQSLLRGFVTGVGIVMITDQLPTQLGIGERMHEHLGSDSPSFQKLIYVIQNISHTHRLTLAFGACGLAALLLSRFVKTTLVQAGYRRAILFPDILMIVICSTIICAAGRFDAHGVAVVGNVSPDKLRLEWMLRPKYWRDFKTNFVTSFSIAILGFLETTVAARALGSFESSSSNRELVALGAANLLGMTVCALPAFGAYGRSKINALSGAKTQLASVVISLVTLFATYNLMRYLYYLPRAILSSVITMIGITLVEESPKDIKFFWRVGGYNDIATIFVSLVVTYCWSLEAGVAVGTGFAVIRVIHHAARPRIQILTRKPGTHTFVNADDMPDMPPGAPDLDSGILVVKVPEPLTFANSGDLSNRLRRLEMHGTARAHPGRPRTKHDILHHAVFDLNGMTQCDASAAATLKEIIERYISKGIIVMVADVPPNKAIQERLSSSGIRELLTSQQCPRAIFGSLAEAFQSFDAEGL